MYVILVVLGALAGILAAMIVTGIIVGVVYLTYKIIDWWRWR